MLAAESKVVAGGVAQAVRPEAPRSWKQLVDPVEPFLEAVSARLSKQVEEFDPALASYAEYALGANGKHLRPTLVALAGECAGKMSESHVTVAAIIEMVHLATLVHDDIMDEAEIRRSQPTLAANWGNEIAVLFGDCLFARAVELAASFPSPEICRAVARASKNVCSGEILQTQHRRDFERSQREYFRVLEMKTAELFALSCDLAACLSGATAAERGALRQFGQAFGTAYQIYDDCVDLFGSEAEAGKSLGTDLAKGKLTLPVLLAWERATPGDRVKLEQMVQQWQPASFPQVSELLERYKTREPSLQVIRQYLNTARHALDALSESGGRASLIGLTEYLSQQTASLLE